jgi:hypothetical protein
MKNYTLASLVIASAVLLVIAAGAKANDVTAQKATKVHSGEVASVNAANYEIVIKDSDGTEAHVMVSSTTKITREGKSITLSGLKAGDKITCECESSAGACKAKSVQVTAPKPGH